MYVSDHQAALALISRVDEVGNPNAPHRADASIPDASCSGTRPRATHRMFLAALMSACAACPQCTQVKSSRVLRLAASAAPHTWHVLDVFFAGTVMTFAALQSSICFSAVHPVFRMTRFSPAFCGTLAPGFSMVPLADLVMAFTFRLSTATVPAFAARRRLTW